MVDDYFFIEFMSLADIKLRWEEIGGTQIMRLKYGRCGARLNLKQKNIEYLLNIYYIDI